MGMGGKPTAADLPEELIRREILTRLPVRSLVRFKSVSKSWLSLLSEPRFITQHLTHSATQIPNDCLVAKRNTKVIILSRHEERVALDSPHYVEVVGCVRGLVCLASFHMLFLWNPATHQFKEIFTPVSRADRKDQIGFGFDHVTDIYKIVILSDDLSSAMVYYSNSGKWIDVSVGNVGADFSITNSTNRVTIVKDCPYWTFRGYPKDKHMNGTNCLIALKFDAVCNEFKLMTGFFCHKVGGLNLWI